MEIKLSFMALGALLCCTKADLIPEEVQQRLRMVRTKEDFEASFTLNHAGHPTPTKTVPGSVRSKARPSVENFRSNAASSEPEIFQVKSFELNAVGPSGAESGQTELITNPVQSDDTCMKMNVCVPVPVKREPHVYFFPQCIQLEQCLGACCDGQQQCHAQKETPVKVVVEKWEYEGVDHVTFKPKFSSKLKQLVRMNRHVSCGCKPCARTKRCTAKQEFKDCQCQCTNNTEALFCTGNWKWDLENCSCNCGIQSCPENRILNPNTCRCVENFQTAAPNVPNGASGVRPSINISNLARLPKLTYKKRNRNRGVRPYSFE